jgi:PAS domain S-box-containing protein
LIYHWYFILGGDLPTKTYQELLKEIESLKLENAQLKSANYEDIYRRSFERHMAVKLIIDPVDGKIYDANSAAADYYGWTLEELRSMNIQQINISPAGTIRNEMNKAKEHKKYRFEFKHKLANGSIRDVEVLSVGISGLTGKEYLHSIVFDISDRKQVENSLRREQQVLELFVEHSPAAIAMLDKEMKYIAVSKRYLVDYHLGDIEVIGRSHYEVFPEIQESWKEVHRCCLGGATEKCDADPFPRSSGEIDWVHWEIHPWYENEEEIGGIILFSEVITERKHFEEELKSITQQLKFHTENTPLAVTEFNNQYQISKWSDNATKMFGWEANEVLGKKINDLPWVYKEDIEIVDSLINEMSSGSKTSNINTNRNYRKDGSIIICEWYNSALMDSEGKLISVQSLIQDVTERKRIEKELIQSEKKFKSLVWDMQVGVLLQGPKAEILLSNPKALELLGLSEDQLLGKTSFDPDWNVIHEDGSQFPGSTHPVPKAIEYRRPIQNVVMGVYRPVDHDRIWLLVDAIPELDINGNIVHVVCTFVDITKRKQSEEKLKAALKDKEVLLRELYHRTKNNMQVVSSLLGLKGETVVENETKEMLMDIGNRIQAIALVHEKLYQSKNLSWIDLKDYITDLATLLLQSYNSKERKIKLTFELESRNVLIDTAIPCGQIIIELISNSLKHAFPNGGGGEITIGLSSIEKDLIELRVSDNGIGIPDYSELTDGKTLGIPLFRNIVEGQLQGDISYNMENGVSWTVRFKDVLYEERVV